MVFVILNELYQNTFIFGAHRSMVLEIKKLNIRLQIYIILKNILEI